MLLILVISSAVVLGVEGQGNSTQHRGITNNAGNQSAQPILNNAEAIKLAETLADTANQLLSILKRGSAGSLIPAGKDTFSGGFSTIPPFSTTDAFSQFLSATEAPAVLCPSGRVQAQCNPDPCATWDCSNIAGVQCERSCDSCDPIFKTRGRDVTSICEIRRIPQPLHLMTAPISPFDTFASEVISALDLDFLPGDFLDKLRERQAQSTSPQVLNEDNFPAQTKRNKRPRKKKSQKKRNKSKIPKEMTKIVKTTTTTPEPMVIRKPDIWKPSQEVNPKNNKNDTRTILLPTREKIAKLPNIQSRVISSSILDQIPLSVLNQMLPGVQGLLESNNNIYDQKPAPEAFNSRRHTGVTLHQPMLSNVVVNYKDRQAKVLPLTPRQFNRINSDPNRNAILQSLRDILSGPTPPPSPNMQQNYPNPRSRMPELRLSSANNQNALQNNVIDSNVPFQRKGRGPLKFFNRNP